MKIVSIIPIKMENKRLNGKNTKLLNEKPLIHYIQESLTNVQEIDEHYVYCSNTNINSFLFPEFRLLIRPKELDLDTSNFTEIFRKFCDEVDADIYVYAHATAPFLKSSTISSCLTAVQSGKYDSAFTAEKIQDYIWSEGIPLNFDAKKVPRSQDLCEFFRETSGVYVFTKETFTKYHRRVGINPYIHPVNFKESIDINYSSDFNLAEIMSLFELE